MTSAPEATEICFPVCRDKTELNTTSGANGPYQVSALDLPLPTVLKQGQESIDPTVKPFSFNQNHVVCLPVVTESLQLIWTRPEQQNQQIGWDAVSELEKHFNIFPYPTMPEMTTLALRFSLPPDQVRVWFMTQRLSYGVSWDCQEICDARTKLCGRQAAKGGACMKETAPRQRSKPGSKAKDNIKNLQHCFQQTPKPSEEQLITLHKETGLSMKTIGKWFNTQRCLKRCREQLLTNKKTSTLPRPEAGDSTGSAVKRSSDDDDVAGGTSTVSLAHATPANSGGWVKKWADPPVPAASQEMVGGAFPYGSHGNARSIQDVWESEAWREAVSKMPSSTAVEGSGPAPPPPPLSQSMSLFPGSSMRKTRLGNKTVIQLQLLRETFTILQWPSAEDYDGLQRLTGLTRRQLTHWFGDMRYHVKQGMARWIRPEERMKVLAQVLQGPASRSQREERDGGPDLSDILQLLGQFLPSLEEREEAGCCCSPHLSSAH